MVLPLRSVLQHSVLAPESAPIPGGVENLITQWLHGAVHSMYWVNLLLTLRARGLPASTQADSYAAGTTTISAAELAEPKFGTSVKTLFWCAATCALAKLQVLEKDKPVPLIPVWLALRRSVNLACD